MIVAIYREISGRILSLSAGAIRVQLTQPRRVMWIPRRQLLHTPNAGDTLFTVEDRWFINRLRKPG